MRLTRKQACQILQLKELESYDAGIVKKAYLQQAKKWHPDKCDHPDAKSRFQEVSAAYELLLKEDDDEYSSEEEYYDVDDLDDFIAQEFFRYMFNRMYGHPGAFGSEPSRREQREWFRKKKADAAKKAKKEASQNRQQNIKKDSAKAANKKEKSVFKDELGESLRAKVGGAQPARPVMVTRAENTITLNLAKKGLLSTDVVTKERPLSYQMQFRPSSGSHPWDVVTSRDAQAVAEGLTPGTKYDFMVRHGIKYKDQMMWSQWSVTSSYPTAGNPPPTVPSTKEPQAESKKKKDDEGKAKKKVKPQQPSKELDPAEIAAKARHEKDKQKAIEAALEAAARDFARESEKLAENLSKTAPPAPKPNPKPKAPRPKSRRRQEDNSDLFWQQEEESQKPGPGDRPAIDDPTVKKVNFGAASRFDPRSQNNNWGPDGPISAAEQAQIEEAIQLSLALESSLSHNEIEAQKRALAAFESQNAFKDSFGGVAPKRYQSPPRDSASYGGQSRSRDYEETNSRGYGGSSSQASYPQSSSANGFHHDYEPYVEPEDNVPMPTWDVPAPKPRRSHHSGVESSPERAAENQDGGWKPEPNVSTNLNYDQGWGSGDRVADARQSSNSRADDWDNSQQNGGFSQNNDQNEAHGWNQWDQSEALGKSIWGKPSQDKSADNFAHDPWGQGSQQQENKEQAWKDEWNSQKSETQSFRNYQDQQEQQGRGSSQSQRQSQDGWGTVSKKNSRRAENSVREEIAPEQEENHDEGGWKPTPNQFVQEDHAFTWRNDPRVAGMNWNSLDLNDDSQDPTSAPKRQPSQTANYKQYEKRQIDQPPGLQNRNTGPARELSNRSMGSSQPESTTYSQQGSRGYESNANGHTNYRSQPAQAGQRNPPPSHTGWGDEAVDSQDDSEDEFAWGKPQPRLAQAGQGAYQNQSHTAGPMQSQNNRRVHNQRNDPQNVTSFAQDSRKIQQTQADPRYVVPGRREEEEATFDDLFQDLFPK